MTIQFPKELEQSIHSLVQRGQFATEDEVVIEAVRSFLSQRKTSTTAVPHESREDLQHRLVAAGLLSEVKAPIEDLEPYRNRRAVSITGEPLSETVIRERR